MADYMEIVGCECAQIFAKSPRQWKAKPLDPVAIEEMASLQKAGRVGPLFTHTSYLINLTTTNDELREKSIDALAEELSRGSALGAVGVNTHIGSVPDGDYDAAGERAARSIEEAFKRAGGQENLRTMLLLENTAGAGTIFGGDINQLVHVINEADIAPDKLGVTIDSCHAWAYGYDVSGEEGWREIRSILEEIGLERWKLVHANDCKFGLGARKDRHEWIGRGEIGSEGFRALLHMKEVNHLCLTTEMPGEMPEKDIVNNEALKALRDS